MERVMVTWIGTFHICAALAANDVGDNCASMSIRNQPTFEACHAAMDLFIEEFKKRGPANFWVPVKECRKQEAQG
jgi:hypothetical protein